MGRDIILTIVPVEYKNLTRTQNKNIGNMFAEVQMYAYFLSYKTVSSPPLDKWVRRVDSIVRTGLKNQKTPPSSGHRLTGSLLYAT